MNNAIFIRPATVPKVVKKLGLYHFASEKSGVITSKAVHAKNVELSKN